MSANISSPGPQARERNPQKTIRIWGVTFCLVSVAWVILTQILQASQPVSPPLPSVRVAWNCQREQSIKLDVPEGRYLVKTDTAVTNAEGKMEVRLGGTRMAIEEVVFMNGAIADGRHPVTIENRNKVRMSVDLEPRNLGPVCQQVDRFVFTFTPE